MGNSAKEKRQYIIINVLLILIVLLLGVYIYKVIQSNKQQIKVGYEQGVNVVQQLQDEYINVEKVHAILNEIKETRDSIVKSLSGIDYNKIMHAHDWIINNLDYEQNITNNNVYNLYGALIEKSAVCEGYAETLKYILDEVDIPCVLVSGTATNSEGKTERHEWNYVQLYGKWYAIDSTWDDPVIKGTGYVSDSIKHRYFLVGSNEMNKNHFPNGQMTESGKKFVYPTIETEKYGK